MPNMLALQFGLFSLPRGCTALFAGACLAGPGSPVAAQEPIHLRAADIHDAGYPTVRGIQAMADRLDEATDGRIRLKIYPGAQLGDERDMLEIAIFGGIDVSRTSMAPLNSIVPETGVYSLPFLFRSTEHMRRVLDGPIGEEILARLQPHGLVGLAYYDAGARSMYNTVRPIHSPADMEGMKIRVMNSGIFVDIEDDIDKQPFIDAMDPLYAQYLQDSALRSLVERIRAVR